MEWLLNILPLNTIIAYVGTVALGYAIGWWRTNKQAQAVWDAIKDGKIDEAEAAAAVGFIKTLLGKIR